MFLIKNKNPIYAVVMGLVMMSLLLAMMNNLYKKMQKEDKGLALMKKSLGNFYFSEEHLEPFRVAKYTSGGNLSSVGPALSTCFKQIEDSNRDRLAPFLEMQISWSTAFKNPGKHIGVLFPLYADKIQSIKKDESLNGYWLTIEGMKNLRVLTYLVNEERVKTPGPFYMDAFYMGRYVEGGNVVHIALSREVYEMPAKGFFAEQVNDKIATSNILDDYQFPYEGRKVSQMAFFHFVSKIQKGKHLTEPLMQNVGYGELMEAPQRYRGKMVTFTGTLIFFKRRRIVNESASPGMEFFYEGLLLNSDRIEFAFRSLRLPEGAKYRDLIRMKGYFLQRYNFSNARGRSTWVPMVIASDLTILKPLKIGFSQKEQIGLVIGAVFLLMIMGVIIHKGYKRSLEVNANRKVPDRKFRPQKGMKTKKTKPKKLENSEKT